MNDILEKIQRLKEEDEVMTAEISSMQERIEMLKQSKVEMKDKISYQEYKFEDSSNSSDDQDVINNNYKEESKHEISKSVVNAKPLMKVSLAEYANRNGKENF